MHAQAAGYGLKESKIKSFIDYSNLELKDLDFSSNTFEVNFSRFATDEDLKLVINELGDVDDLWGTNCPKPKIEVKNINVPRHLIQIIGSKKDTLRFEKNGIVYIKFKATDLIDEINFTKGDLIFHVVGEPNINYWNGYETPQVLISNCEFEEDSNSF